MFKSGSHQAVWDPQWLADFEILEFPAGAKIISLDEPLIYNYYLQSGICARTNPTANGEDLIMQYLHAGDMIGLFLQQFGKTAVSQFEARKSCRCIRIPYEAVQEKVRSDSALCYDLLQLTVWDLDFWAVSYLTKTLGGGISILSLALLDQARKQSDGSWLIDPMFTNVELSAYCGLHTVSISRLMRQLTQEGILERTREGILLYNPEKLADYAKGSD